MIGGRVLDRTVLVAFARQTSIYAAALVWTAVEEDVVLLVPTSASALARGALDPTTDEVLDVLLDLPVVVDDDLTRARGREAGAVLAGRDVSLDVAHAAVCGRLRGWPVVTGAPERYADLDGVDVEPTP